MKNAFNQTNYVSLGNHKCMVQPTFINLHPNEYSQEFHEHPFAVKLCRCVGSVILLMSCLIKYVFEIERKI